MGFGNITVLDADTQGTDLLTTYAGAEFAEIVQ